MLIFTVIWADVLSERMPYPVSTVNAAAELAGLSTVTLTLSPYWKNDGYGSNAILSIFTSDATVLELRCEIADVDEIGNPIKNKVVTASSSIELQQHGDGGDTIGDDDPSSAALTVLGDDEATAPGTDEDAVVDIIKMATSDDVHIPAGKGDGDSDSDSDGDGDGDGDRNRDGDEDGSGDGDGEEGEAAIHIEEDDADEIDLEMRILERGRALAWHQDSLIPTSLQRSAPAAGSFAGGKVESITALVISENGRAVAAGCDMGEVWFWEQTNDGKFFSFDTMTEYL